MNLKYRIHWPAWVHRLLPSFLRRRRITDWLLALLTPLRRLYHEFLRYREESNRFLAYNSQTLILRELLNGSFPEAGITITNRLPSQTVYPGNALLLEEQVDIVYPGAFNALAPLVFPGKGATEPVPWDFTIEVSNTLTGKDEALLRRLVDQYKHSGFTYEVIYINQTNNNTTT